MIDPIKIIDYEKISDDVLQLGKNAILRFNVILSNKDQHDNRRHFHNEYSYSSNKYANKDKLYTIRRKYDYYFSIETFVQSEDKEFIMIRVQDMIVMQHTLYATMQWFLGDGDFKDLFCTDKDGKLIRRGSVDPISVKLFTLKKNLAFEPIVIDYENDSVEGVRVYLNSESNYVDIPFGTISALAYIFTTFDMIGNAQNMINYNGRPELGTNLMEMGQGTYQNFQSRPPSKAIPTGRIIPGLDKRDTSSKLDSL